MEIPSSHKPNTYDLPSLEGNLINPSGSINKLNINDAFEFWMNAADSNLLVMMGGFGTGKTTSLSKILSKWYSEIDLINFDQIVILNEGIEGHVIDQINLKSNSIVLIDNFDSINSMTGIQTYPPDLRIISGLAKNHRVVVATRRNLNTGDDELLNQINSNIRLLNLGFNKPYILEFLPWDLNDIDEFSESYNVPNLKTVSNFLKGFSSEESIFLRRPLLITMMLDISEELNKLRGGNSVAQIYQLYCNVVTSNDFDKQRSRISGKLKKRILSELAFDVFSGLGGIDSPLLSLYSISVSRISERVLENVMRDPTVRSLTDVNKYNWTDDFLSTNHFIESSRHSTLGEFADPIYEFRHQSFYEYFVSLAFLRRISNGNPFGLTFEKLSSGTVDSLSFAFVKEIGGSEIRNVIRSIVTRPRLSPADRLVLLYFLEDEIDFKKILEESKEDYVDELESKEKLVENFFLKKMIRYQLVITGRYSSDDYISEVTSREDDKGLQLEQRLHSAEVGVTAQLLLRLRNPSLVNARLITIYRLGQLGDKSAIPELEILSSVEPNLIMAINEAIQKINSRYK